MPGIRIALKRSVRSAAAGVVLLASTVLTITGVGTTAALAENVLRWSAAGEPLSLDPNANNETLTTAMLEQMYETLVGRDRNLKPVPGLAESWSQVSPTVWQFKIRQGVKFHEGQSLTADDVVFSIGRAGGANSGYKYYVGTVKEVRKVDDYTVEVETKSPDPILLNEFMSVFIMSKAWAEQHNVTEPQDWRAQEETYAVRNANGTGPFKLESFEPGVKTVLVKNPDWWNKEVEHNIDRAIFTPIANEATRVAALLSGQIDFTIDLPLQSKDTVASNPAYKVADVPELRTMVFGMDQFRDELPGSDVKGKNPFKDKRVRQAMYQAIDIEAIKDKIMAGAADPTALVIAPAVNGYDEALDVRLPYDPEAAKKLLAEAGYPDGFTVSMECSNDRYVNDGRVCQAAASMFGQIGIKINLTLESKVKWFPRIQNFDTSLYLMGFGVPTFDAGQVLVVFTDTYDKETASGLWNVGRYPNPAHETIQKIGTEMDPAARTKLIHEALTVIRDDVGFIPLYNQVITWGMTKNIDTPLQPNNSPQLKWTRIN